MYLEIRDKVYKYLKVSKKCANVKKMGNVNVKCKCNMKQ